MRALSRALPLALAAALASTGLTLAEEPAAPRSEGERLAESILRRAEQAMRREFDPAFRSSALARLASLPAEELRDRAERGGPLVPGGTVNPELVYKALPPCRIVDTRMGGGALAAGAPRDFKVAGTGHQGQGGGALGCNVPVGSATAAAINFVAVNATGPGNLRAWAYNVPPVAPPNASIINYAAVGLNIANAVIVPLCDPAVSSACDFDVSVQADLNGTHLVADVLGYFEALRKPTIASGAQLTADVAVPNTACTNIPGAQVAITVPGPGKVEVMASVAVRLTHTMGIIDLMNLQFAANATDCNFIAGYGQAWVQGSLPNGNYIYTLPVTKIFDVPAAGTYTFHLNANMESGGDGTDTVQGNFNETSPTRATYYPN
jgi:hypothetical protein